MPVTQFDQLPDEARLWIFAAERPLDDTQREQLLAEADGFLAQWTAHQAPVTAARDFRYDQFLLIGVNEEVTGLSGCSIDALMHALQALGSRLGVELVESPPVWYRADDQIQGATRERFAEHAAQGIVNADTVVFDNTVATVKDLRAGKWETPARATWHGRVFFASSER